MRRKIPWYRSLRFRLPIMMALCCIIPTVLFSVYTRRQTRQWVLDNARAAIYTNLYGSSLLLEGLMEDVAGDGKETAADERLREYIRGYMDFPGRREAARSRITLLLGQRLSSIRSLDALYLIWDETETILSTDPGKKEIPVSEGWGKELADLYEKQAKGSIAWLFVPEAGGAGGLCYFRPLNLGDGYGNCSLVCQVRRENWEAAFQLPFRTGNMLMCDYFGDLLLEAGADPSSEGPLTERFPEAFSGKNNYDTYIHRDKDGSWLVMYYNSINHGWKYITRVSVDELLEDTRSSPGLPVVMILMGILAAAAAYFLQSRLILRPLRELGAHLQRMESGNLTLIGGIRQKDEMGALQENYNHMIGELKRNIDEVYVQQLLRKQAQLNSLQSQIDEHFLYNTLNMIYCEACGEHADKSAHMLWILSRYFRLNLSEGRDKVPLSEVLNLIKLYLAIQKARFGDGLYVEEEVFSGMDDYLALKYLFQPVVENAIIHGFEKKLGDHHLKIIFRKEENEILFFCVKDDGVGMSEEQLASLQEELRTFETVEGSGYALKNLREQLRITYGEEYTIQIRSRLGEGTEVSFRIPLERRETEPGRRRK